MDESEPAVNTTAEGWFHWCVAIYHRIVPGSFPNPAVSFGVCYSAVDAAAGGLTTGWWDVVLECLSSHPLVVCMDKNKLLVRDPQLRNKTSK